MKTDLVEIFQTIRAVMQPYSAQGFEVRKNSETAFDLWSNKNVIINGSKKTEVHFAEVRINKGYVALYFMPVYVDADLKKVFHNDLLSLLKGKSCFHFKKLDDTLLKHIEQALQAGYILYRQQEWV